MIEIHRASGWTLRASELRDSLVLIGELPAGIALLDDLGSPSRAPRLALHDHSRAPLWDCGEPARVSEQLCRPRELGVRVDRGEPLALRERARHLELLGRFA